MAPERHCGFYNHVLAPVLQTRRPARYVSEVSNNGRQFKSQDKVELCLEFNVVHLRCAPGMRQSNGLAERMVRTLKSALADAVAAYNFTPNSASNGETPNKKFFARDIKTQIDLYKPCKVFGSLLVGTNPTSSASVLFNVQSLLGTFNHRPDYDLIFDACFFCNQPILESSIEDDRLRSQILLKCLGDAEYRRLRYRISPELPESKTYTDLIELLKATFGSSKSLFRCRHEILMFRADSATPSSDIINFANIKGDEFEFKDLTLNQFKIFLCLLFASGPSFKNHTSAQGARRKSWYFNRRSTRGSRTLHTSH